VNLISAEWRRLFARRFTRIMLLAVLAILAVIGVGVGVNSHQRTAATHAAAVARAQQDNEQMMADCLRSQQDTGSPSDVKQFPPGFDCTQIARDGARPEYYEPYEFSFRAGAPALVQVMGALLAMLGFIVGASFVGAEWHSGGMTNLLLWRPRRVPVLLGKLTALLGGMVSASVGYSAVWLGTVWAIASTRGRTAGMTAGAWRSLALDDVRAVALGLFAATIGFAVASIGRHTATALGAAVGYLVVLELGGHIVLALLQVHRPERYFLSNYVFAWLTKATWFDDYPANCGGFGQNCEPQRWAIHLNQGLLALGIAVTLTLGWALWSMRRRDVT